jgi:hypothetical protein
MPGVVPLGLAAAQSRRIAASLPVGWHVYEVDAVANGIGQLHTQGEVLRRCEMAVLVIAVVEVKPTLAVAWRPGEHLAQSVDYVLLVAELARSSRLPVSVPPSTATSYWTARSSGLTAREISATSSAIASA